jgi:hypothetical protein
MEELRPDFFRMPEEGCTELRSRVSWKRLAVAGIGKRFKERRPTSESEACCDVSLERIVSAWDWRKGLSLAKSLISSPGKVARTLGIPSTD